MVRIVFKLIDFFFIYFNNCPARHCLGRELKADGNISSVWLGVPYRPWAGGAFPQRSEGEAPQKWVLRSGFKVPGYTSLVYPEYIFVSSNGVGWVEGCEARRICSAQTTAGDYGVVELGEGPGVPRWGLQRWIAPLHVCMLLKGEHLGLCLEVGNEFWSNAARRNAEGYVLGALESTHMDGGLDRAPGRASVPQHRLDVLLVKCSLNLFLVVERGGGQGLHHV